MLRFAPSPTKDMDIGDLRVAILNHILSKQLNKELLIRIDDSDKSKNIEGKEKEILEILNLFSIEQSRVVSQSENIKYHTQMAMKLLLDKKAFNCFCSKEAIEQDKEKAKQDGKPYSYSGFCKTISDETKFNCNAPFVVRIDKPKQNIKFTDLIKGDLEYKPSQVDSFTILKTDKSPTDNFTCAVDDMLFDISTIIRGDNHLLNTAKQIHTRDSLGYTKEIEYIHIPLIQNQNRDNNKLVSVNSLIDQGYLPAAIANYLLSLGYETPKEIFTLEEAKEWFDIKKLSKQSPKFDISKLNSINKEHLKLIDELRLSKIISYADKDIGTLAKIYLQECNTTKEIKAKIDDIFAPKHTNDSFKDDLDKVKECIKDAPFMEKFDNLKEYVQKKTNLKEEELSIALRFALTAQTAGPNLGDIYPLIKNYLGEIVK
ncbi:MAG: glutamate--tRNA ligase [Campylobacterota bacterium]|nr:glutamate--tRNA ligase [Campylobacterota bacterium]